MTHALRLSEVVTRLAVGERSAAELVESARHPDDLAATEQLVPSALTLAAEADARRARRCALGPLDGVPFAVKANLDVAGIATTAGTGLRVEPLRDAAAVAALRSCGMIPVRTATLAELALGSITDNPHTGACRNPRNRSLNAGGSSGGSAALVAAGIVPVALGSDTMGSVRIPAAYCAVTGYKPSRGAIDTAGLTPLHPLLDTVGVLAARAVDVQAVACRLVAGVSGAAASDGPAPRIGVPELAATADADGRAALQTVLSAARALGAAPVPMRLDVDVALIRRRGLLLCEADTYARFADAVDGDDQRLSRRVRELLRYGRDAGAGRVAEAHAAVEEASVRISRAFDEFDVLVLPTTPAGPPPLRSEPAHAADLSAWANVAGLPAVSIPAGPPTTDGMSRGVQLVGRPGADGAVIALAVALQDAGLTP
jgi:aspartyl-tRNA(Asn)/glutamyl-tRNA(Gln) amidotransferase subunit A